MAGWLRGTEGEQDSRVRAAPPLEKVHRAPGES